MTRFSGWTVAGVLAAMLVAVLHAFAECQLARVPKTARLFPHGWFD